IPEAPTEVRLEVEAVAGDPADLADGPAAVAVGRERWAGCDGAKVVAGDIEDMAALAAGLRDRPLIAHDAKALGAGGRTAARPPRAGRPSGTHGGPRPPGPPRAAPPPPRATRPPTRASRRSARLPKTKASLRSATARSRSPTRPSSRGSRTSSARASASAS